MITRRQFVQGAAAAAVAVGLGGGSALGQEKPLPTPSPAKLPRWRGFNLLEKFTAGRRAGAYKEFDFEVMAEWGFNFVRLPMSYLCWSSAQEWKKIDEKCLAEVDQAVEMGRKHGIHVNINFHRAPGYCVNPPKEPLDLFADPSAQEACCFHWAHFAKRYKGIPSSQVSFDLLNEPGDMPEEKYALVIRKLVEAIRAEDPDRLIIADGLRWGNSPVHALADLKIGQSTRGYTPMPISHYKASWVNQQNAAAPTWPLTAEKDAWDKARLRRERIDPWKALEKKGVGVHVGEWGAYQYTPHEVALSWMRDCLDLWKEAGWGWSLWNLRGSFGILDSGRTDIQYENFRGRKLDRKMLELLRAN